MNERDSHPPELKLWQYQSGDDSQAFDPAAAQQQLKKSEGKQPAVNALDPWVVIKDSKHHADRPSVDFGQGRESRLDQEAQRRAHMADFAFREREEAPVPAIRFVVKMQECSYVGLEATRFQVAELDLQPLSSRLRNANHLLIELRDNVRRRPVGVQIVCFAEAEPFKQRTIEGRI